MKFTTISLTITRGDDEKARDVMAWVRGMEKKNFGMLFVQLEALYECHMASTNTDSGSSCDDPECSLCLPPKKTKGQQPAIAELEKEAGA